MASFDGRSGSNDRRLVATGTNHATLINATSANAAVESGTGNVNAASDDFFTPDYYIRRSAIEFDLTAIPAGSTITNSPTLKINFGSVPNDTNNQSVNAFYFTRASSEGGAFDLNDFDEAKGTAAATAKDITGLTGVQTFTLNAGAIADLEANFGGYAQFSLRMSGDYGGSGPTGANTINAYMGNDGTESNRPRLEFTYDTPTSGGNPMFFSSGGVTVG